MKPKRLYTLMKKDIVTCFTDKTTLIMLAMPVFFCVFCTMTMESLRDGYILILCSIFNLSLTSICILPTLIADEKDKGTIIILYRAGVSNREFVGAKVGVVMMLTFVIALLMFFATHADTRALFVYLILNMMAAATLIPIGAIVAIFAKDQNSANVYSTLPILIFMLCPAFALESDVCKQFSKILPTNMIPAILFDYLKGPVPFTREFVFSLVVCLIWFFIGCVVFLYLYKKKGLGVVRKIQL